jgi:uncharacterized protein (TIGR00369 family)
MKMDKQKFFDHIKQASGSNPYHKMLGIEPVEIREGYAKVLLNYRDLLDNPYGRVHGGVLASLIDVAIGIAVITALEVGERTVTADMRINYLNSLEKQKGYAVAKLIRRGKSMAVGEAEVYSDEGVLVAKATGTYYIMQIDLELWQKQAGIELNSISQDNSTN